MPPILPALARLGRDTNIGALHAVRGCAAGVSLRLTEYYRQVAQRIDHNRACLSVARKLCRRAYHILRELGDEALAPIETPDREEVIAAAA